MFDWSGKNGNKSGKSQGILISCMSGNLEKRCKMDQVDITLNNS